MLVISEKGKTDSAVKFQIHRLKNSNWEQSVIIINGFHPPLVRRCSGDAVNKEPANNLLPGGQGRYYTHCKKNSYNMILSFHLFWLIVTWPTLQTKHRKTPLFLSICWQRWMWGRLCYPIQRLPATNITGHQTPEAKLVERKICGSPLLQCQAGRQSIPPVDVNNNAPSRCLIYIAHRPALL